MRSVLFPRPTDAEVIQRVVVRARLDVGLAASTLDDLFTGFEVTYVRGSHLLREETLSPGHAGDGTRPDCVAFANAALPDTSTCWHKDVIPEAFVV